MNGANRIEGDCNGTASGLSYTTNTRFSPHIPNGENMGSSGTCNHFTSVVDNTLMVFIGTMGEIHANFIANESDNKTALSR